MSAEIKIIGIEQLQKNCAKIAANLSASQVDPEILKAADIVADEMRRRAPIGETGNLKNSVVSKLLPSKGFQYRGGFAGIERRLKGYHAHLVEYGTAGPRTPKKARILVSKEGQVFGTEVKAMPAHPFLRPAADLKMPAAYESLEKNLKKLVEDF